VLARLRGTGFVPPPPTTALGALLEHVTASEVRPYTPSNMNFGLLQPLQVDRRMRKRARREMLARKALADLAEWRGAAVT
jgi:methylenetetrahydrofolate--tRNA-(uracil-5-)-methyltransferase